MADGLIQISSNTWINTRYIVYINIRQIGNKTEIVIMDRNKTYHRTIYDNEIEARELVDRIVNKHNEITISEEK